MRNTKHRIIAQSALHLSYAYPHNLRCVPHDLCCVPHNCWCIPLNLCRRAIAVLSTVSSPELLKTCVALRATDALHTVYVAAYSTTVYVVIHLMLQPCKLMSYCDITNVVRPQPLIYVVSSVTYDVMSLIAIYVRYLCCSMT